jgi:hypothetical protein
MGRNVNHYFDGGVRCKIYTEESVGKTRGRGQDKRAGARQEGGGKTRGRGQAPPLRGNAALECERGEAHGDTGAADDDQDAVATFEAAFLPREAHAQRDGG